MRPTFLRIYINNFIDNLSQIKSLTTKKTKICVAVKADAYGHGAIECAKAAEKFGVDFLAVASVSEGKELRENGISLPILLLSLCDISEFDELVAAEITPFVFDPEYILSLSSAVKKAGLHSSYNVHLAIDTGMGRIGCAPQDASCIAKLIAGTENLFLEGVATHFSVADSVDFSDIAYTKKQFELFNFAIESIKKAGISPGICHCANSAACISLPETHLDMVRPGIIVYGYYPGEITKAYCVSHGINIDLKPVMALVSKVSAVRQIKKGESVSYGRLWTSEQNTKIAVLPVGYADGFFRNLSDCGLFVEINQKQYPLIGRICMDQCMIDLGNDCDVKRGDEAVIFGPEESGAFQSAQKIADISGTISYEITCAFAKKRVPRVYIYR